MGGSDDSAEGRSLTSLGHAVRAHFLFGEGWVNLNHGSFGAFPSAVMDALRRFQAECELRPDVFIRYTYPAALDRARSALADLVKVPVDEVVLLQNATTGVNTILRSLVFEPGQKVLYFNTTYGACERTVDYLEETTPVKGLKLELSYPLSDDALVDMFRGAIRQENATQPGRVKVALLDTVVSMPGVRMPFERMVQVCRGEGVLSLVDGAHGVGHIPLDLAKLDADFFVSNCHKWLHVPRGCALFHVPQRNQHLIRSSLPTSHGWEPLASATKKTIPNPLPPSNKSPFVAQFEFVGTIDNAPYLCIPEALAWRRDVCGGEDAITAYNIDLAREGGQRAASILGTEVLENAEGTLGACCMVNVRLPLTVSPASSTPAGTLSLGDVPAVMNWLSERLIRDHDTFIAGVLHNGAIWARFSAQVYLDASDFEWGAKVLEELCERVRAGEGGWVAGGVLPTR
ncbi:MAG: hypothetical protein M1832_004039 [Thelocarpon impressellum]|nr:MAG: hypothetical protein M1832_004039 [Thelocarpon impressellum]